MRSQFSFLRHLKSSFGLALGIVCFAAPTLGAVDLVQTVIDDLTLAGDAKPHGTDGLDWGDGAMVAHPNPPGVTVPAKNYKGEWFQAMTNWGQVYIPREGSTAINTRCQIRNMTTKFLLDDDKWYVVQGPATPGGSAYVENFQNDSNKGAGARDETNNGGGISVVVGVGAYAGYNFHFFVNPRASVDVNKIKQVFTSCEARLIVDDPTKPDDRAQCKNILDVGADWWLNFNTGWLPDWSANSGISGGRFKWVTPEWQLFTMTTQTVAQVRQNPPVESVTPPAVNQPPVVAVNAPVGGATFATGGAVTINAAASDADGHVAKVAFLLDGSLLGEDISAPYAWTWTATAGSHLLAARATDDQGAVTTSAAVQIVVNDPPPIIGPVGYTYCADENASFTLSGVCDVAYGANGSFAFKYRQSGTQNFNNTVFGDPLPGIVKHGFYKISPVAPTIALKINFQPVSAPTVAGWLVDGGQTYGPRNGQTYGWNGDLSAKARDRNHVTAPSQLYDTLIQTQQSTAAGGIWEIAIPNGLYQVRLVAGDPLYINSKFAFALEGITVLSGIPTASAHWIESTQTITVSDGRMTLTNAPGSSNNRIDFIEITSLPSAAN